MSKDNGKPVAVNVGDFFHTDDGVSSPPAAEVVVSAVSAVGQVQQYSVGRTMRGHPSVVAWLENLRGTTFAHGADLVETMLMADNVNIVDKILEALEEDGLIKRVSFVPTVSQQFMGHGGMWAPDIKRIVRAGGLELAPPSWCGWRPVRTPVDGPPVGPVVS